jgi:cellulose synthase/poly-beta-1,6-N-acetylglucosamine synthase-like glycosyltransferase
MVYNEEKNITNLLKSLYTQELKDVAIDRIVVVSSGSTDRTDELVSDCQKKCDRVCLITQDKRLGKPSAINEFLKKSDKEVVVVSSGDIIFDNKAIEHLIIPFRDKTVGMTSVFPVPVNRNNGLMGFVASTHWKMHNALNRHGESIAFRKSLIKSLPVTVVADEAYVEAVTCKKELKAIHVKDAIVFNKGPEAPCEFLKQIRRHFFGHLQLELELHYPVSSMTRNGMRNILKELTRLLINDPTETPYCFGYVFLEFLGRVMGTFNIIFGKKPPVLWEIAGSTKSLTS